MAAAAETIQYCLPEQERCLTEIDNLNNYRLPDGSIPDWAKQEILVNLVTATKEAAMPYAVSRVEHEYKGGKFMWLGKTAVENAASGYRYHGHEEAIKRVDVEVEEAKRTESSLQPGTVHVFISPRMSRKDADYEDAKQEHLADDDSIRVTEALIDKNGNITKRKLESLLVRNIPLEAWVGLLEDSNNLFGKSIKIEDQESALSIMKAHDQLELPTNYLPEGPVNIVEAAIPYIKDEKIKKDVVRQIELFRKNQKEMHEEAVSIAQRWLGFTIELANSLDSGHATFAIETFINCNQEIWGDDDLKTILACQEDCHYLMNRELAALVAKAKENFLWTRAGVAVDNETVIKQLSPALAKQISNDEIRLRYNFDNVHPIIPNMAIQVQLDRQIASHNITVGGGCAGVSKANFNSSNKGLEDPLSAISTSENKSEAQTSGKEKWAWKKGVCVVKSCKTRPGQTEVGPCNVCRLCQSKYDKGEDPGKELVYQKAPKQEGYLAAIITMLDESMQKSS